MTIVVELAGARLGLAGVRGTETSDVFLIEAKEQ
jgi:hypothetical protein